MKNQIKKVSLALLSICMLNSVKLNAQKDTSYNGHQGYRIHTMYFGAMASIPKGGLKDYVPAGLGFKFGSLFYFSKPGLANGKFNIGFKAEWLNVETNVPYGKLNEENPQYSFAVAGNYGLLASFKPVDDLYIDFYYTPGWGFRMFPNSTADDYYPYYYSNDINTSVPHIQFSSAVGFNLRYKALYTGIGFQSLNNPLYANGAYISKIKTLQVTVGLCGFHVRQKR